MRQLVPFTIRSKSRAAAYAVIYEELRPVARKCGYALALHGSLAKDLDIVAVPWTEKATSQEVLVKALCRNVGACTVGNVGDKPHGRKAWTLLFGGSQQYIDLSIMPLAAKTE
jgi:hypothetical protein